MHKNSQIWQHEKIAAILESKSSRNKKIMDLHYASKTLTYDVIACYFGMKECSVLKIISNWKLMQKESSPKKKQSSMKHRFKVKYRITHDNKIYIARAVVFAHHADDVQGELFSYEEKKRHGWFKLELLEVKIEKDPVEELLNMFGMKKTKKHGGG